MKDVMLIIHFIGLVMGVGTSFAFIFLGTLKSKMEKQEGQRFSINTLPLGKMGQIGLLLLVLSGGYLMTPHWQVLTTSFLLMAKLTLVGVLIVLIVVIRSFAKKAKNGDTEKLLNKIGILVKLALLTGLSIVTIAVYYFH